MTAENENERAAIFAGLRAALKGHTTKFPPPARTMGQSVEIDGIPVVVVVHAAWSSIRQRPTGMTTVKIADRAYRAESVKSWRTSKKGWDFAAMAAQALRAVEVVRARRAREEAAQAKCKAAHAALKKSGADRLARELVIDVLVDEDDGSIKIRSRLDDVDEALTMLRALAAERARRGEQLL